MPIFVEKNFELNFCDFIMWQLTFVFFIKHSGNSVKTLDCNYSCFHELSYHFRIYCKGIMNVLMHRTIYTSCKVKTFHGHLWCRKCLWLHSVLNYENFDTK